MIEFIFGKDFNLGLKGIPHFSIFANSPYFDLDPHISPLPLEEETLPSFSLFFIFLEERVEISGVFFKYCLVFRVMPSEGVQQWRILFLECFSNCCST